MGYKNNGNKKSPNGSTANSQGKKRRDYGGYSFINITPSKGDALQAKQAYEAGELHILQQMEFMEAGFDFKVSREDDGETYKAQFTDMRDGSTTYKHILSMRASHPEAAILKVLFYMVFRFDTTWRPVDQGDTPADEWF